MSSTMYPESSNRPANAGRAVTEQRLHDVVELVQERARREHLRTRAWVLLLTAPGWGHLLGQAFGVPDLGTALGSLVGGSYMLALKLGLLV